MSGLVVALLVLASGATALVVALDEVSNNWANGPKGRNTFLRASRRFFLVWVLT